MTLGEQLSYSRWARQAADTFQFRRHCCAVYPDKAQNTKAGLLPPFSCNQPLKKQISLLRGELDLPSVLNQWAHSCTSGRKLWAVVWDWENRFILDKLLWHGGARVNNLWEEKKKKIASKFASNSMTNNLTNKWLCIVYQSTKWLEVVENWLMSRNSVLEMAGTIATTSCLPPLLENGCLRCCFLSNSATKGYSQAF